MNVRQQFAYLGAVLGVRGLDVLARQPWLQQRRLATQFTQAVAVAVPYRVGHWHVGGVQGIEQLDEERHVLAGPALDQRQDELPCSRLTKKLLFSVPAAMP